jgi:formamidopyrimidine-DNA glycosylase
MPELPEVETVARQLAPLIEGRRVRRLRILDPRLRSGRTPPVAGRKIEAVSRSGKRVLIRFSEAAGRGSPLWLAVHLRMTGRLVWTEKAPALDRVRARFQLDRGALLFMDVRRFGTFDWYRTPSEAEPDGLDPLSRRLTPGELGRLIGGTRQCLKAWLLRQDRLVGLGNIYASEILHRAGLSPFREAGTLNDKEIGRLRSAMRAILTRAIRNCGTTFSDFQDARGVEGGYQNLLAVYGREDEPCRRCGAPVERVVQQQRSTFFCPACQPHPRSV